MFFSLSLYPCCSCNFFSPLARRLWFCLGFSPLAPWLWLHLYFSLTTGILEVALCLLLPETLCGRLHLPRCLACTSNTTTQHCALRDRWLAVGARAPWSCSLQQRVLLTMGTDLSFWSFGRFVAAAVRRWFSNTTPTPLCDSLGCVPPDEGLHCGLFATAWSVGSFGTAGVSSILASLSSGLLSLSHASSLHVCS